MPAGWRRRKRRIPPRVRLPNVAKKAGIGLGMIAATAMIGPAMIVATAMIVHGMTGRAKIGLGTTVRGRIADLATIVPVMIVGIVGVRSVPARTGRGIAVPAWKIQSFPAAMWLPKPSLTLR